jgi:tRNA A37 threonylcarbamoyladenosine dehydratase
MNESIFSRTALLFGEAGVERLRSLRVIIFGVGGVGSWCAESLVRTGVGHLTMVDCDVVCDSNINRQLMATTRTVGRPKVEVMRERLLEINPEADITAREEVFSAETAGNFNLDAYDYVIDAIDSLRDKALLILRACESKACLFSSMGAARKLDPQRVKVTEFWKVEGDPLARTLRKRFKHEGVFPARKFQCVYSDERPSGEVGGTAAHVTAVFGLTLAAQVIQDTLSD